MSGQSSERRSGQDKARRGSRRGRSSGSRRRRRPRTNVDHDLQRTSEELMRFASERRVSSWPLKSVVALWLLAALTILLFIVFIVRQALGT